jgi:hypothetical protein
LAAQLHKLDPTLLTCWPVPPIGGCAPRNKPLPAVSRTQVQAEERRRAEQEIARLTSAQQVR